MAAPKKAAPKKKTVLAAGSVDGSPFVFTSDRQGHILLSGVWHPHGNKVPGRASIVGFMRVDGGRSLVATSDGHIYSLYDGAWEEAIAAVPGTTAAG